MKEWYAGKKGIPPADYENASPVKDWEAGLGQLDNVASFVSLVDADIEALGWRAALKLWCGRLLPGAGSHIFHGLLRTAHAARALSAAEESLPRKRELALGIATWATRWDKVAGGILGGTVPPNTPGEDTGASSADVEKGIFAQVKSFTAALDLEDLPRFTQTPAHIPRACASEYFRHFASASDAILAF